MLGQGGREHQGDFHAAGQEARGEAQPQEREGSGKKGGEFDSAGERGEEKMLLSDIVSFDQDIAL